MAARRKTQKLVLVGESGVGKSSIALRFARNEFSQFQESTIGAAFHSQKVVVQGRMLQFEVWDTAGQERYHSLMPMYYRGAKAALVVYSVDSQTSFERAKNWVRELRTANGTNPNMVIAIAGNKCDEVENRQVLTAEALNWANEEGILHMETSAKTGKNILEVFTAIGERLASIQDCTESPIRKQETVKLDQPVESKGWCC